ncbi:hypothetical protein [Neisseria yangbaofengii]|uniref:hypothetical protein n=1 Tax=Neisseria yangbaofengii TaxID=2709396 RepID=UPI0013E9CDA4|nr:hypothetical protein [Neisseria yangbaofengii]
MTQREKNLLNTFPLTILSICLLAACGGGGAKSPSAAPTPTPSAQSPEKIGQAAKSETPNHEPADKPSVPASPDTDAVQPDHPVQPPVKMQPEEPKTDIKPSQPDQPKVETNAPQSDRPEVKTNAPQPDRPEEQAPQTAVERDQDVFSRLNLENRHGLLLDNTLKMVFNDQGKTVEIELIQPQDQFIRKDIRTLRDSNGKITGYYGFAAVNYPKMNDYGEYEGAEIVYHYLQSADESQMRRPVSDNEISYRGNMYYHYTDSPTDFLNADVTAKYYGGSKTLSMMIHDNKGGLWELHQDRSPKSPLRVSVGERGDVGGHLFFHDNSGNRPVLNGTFSGGFYGANGSVLTGKANHDGKNAWQGVIGAVAQ